MQLVIFGLVVLAASVLVMMIKKAICKKSLAANPDKEVPLKKPTAAGNFMIVVEGVLTGFFGLAAVSWLFQNEPCHYRFLVHCGCCRLLN